MRAILKVNKASYLAKYNGEEFEVIKVLGGEKKLYVLNIGGVEVDVTEKEIIILD